MPVLTKGIFTGKWFGISTAFHTEDEGQLSRAHVGDVVRLEGKRYRVTKKTNYNAAVERYTLIDAAEDWLLEKLGKVLP